MRPKLAAMTSIAMTIQLGCFLPEPRSGAGSDGDATMGAAPPGGAMAAAGAASGAKGSGATDPIGRASGAGWAVAAAASRSGDAWSSFSAVAKRDMIGTTLLRAAGAGGVIDAADGLPDGTRGGMPGLLGLSGRGGGMLDRGGGGGPDMRAVDAASRTMAASSGNERTGRHSSRPSCHAKESSVTAPSAALRRISPIRTGPTGTPLTATYQSSLTESSDMSSGAELSSSCWTVLLKAPASAPGGGARSGFGGGGLAAVRLAATCVWRAGAGLGGGRGGGGGLLDRVAAGGAGATAGGAAVAALDSVTAARTSMRCPHLRHFMRTVLPATFSSAIWYLALHWSHRNFTRAPDLDRVCNASEQIGRAHV